VSRFLKESEKSSQIELEILAIAQEIIRKKPLKIEDLYTKAKQKLGNLYSKNEINTTILELVLKKILIPDKKIMKNQVLENKKRNMIYKCIIDNPGVHLREIREKLKLHPHVTNFHLKILESFDFIYRKSYLKYRVYFPKDFNMENEAIILALKHDTAKKIFKAIHNTGELSFAQLKDYFEGEISPKMLEYHLSPLKNCGLIKTIKKDGEDMLIVVQTTLEKIEKYLADLVTPGKLLVRRAYDYVGGDVRFKVVVENASEEVLRDITVHLDVKEQFTTQNKMQMIKLLEPEESRGIDFILTPLACGKSKIHGYVTYQDSYMQSYSTKINPVLVQIKCPLVQPKIMKYLEALQLKERFQVSRAEISYSGIPKDNVFRIAREQIASLDISEIEKGTDAYTTLFSGEAKITGDPILVDLRVDESIKIDVYMSDIKQATGFLAYIKNLIRIALDYSLQISTSVEKIKKMIFNGFEFSSRLSELFNLCETQESLDEILLLLKELQIKSESYFQDTKLTEALITRYNELEQIKDKEIYNRTYLNLQFEVQVWLGAVITFAETNAKIYYESPIDQFTRSEIEMGIFKLKDELNRMAKNYFRKILFTLILIHSFTGLSLYTYNFSEKDLDSDLISGFLTAIQNFGMEVSKEKTRMKRISYEAFEIELIDGEFTVAALTTLSIPNQLTSLALQRFLHRFEAKFKSQLKDFTGNVSQFQSADELIKEIFLKD